MSSSSSQLPEQIQSTSSTHSDSAKKTIIAQTSLDAQLQADFSGSGGGGGSRKVTTAYLHQIQKSNLIQPFGCLLALHDKTLRVIGFSENASRMLQSPISLLSDIRTLFTPTSGAALQKALGISEISLLNPILVRCASSGSPFYAIIHRVTSTLMIDFEPVRPHEAPTMAAGALQSYKLAAKAIARLQALPSGSMERLCDTMAHEVFELTAYDRVMIYKFHDDNHGEVLTEITTPGLLPFVGLHYPATDIPLASRFLFMKNKVRMISDCRSHPVRVHQDESTFLNLCGSTLRAPHPCHRQYMDNMSSMASLVMSVVLNDEPGTGEPSHHPHKTKKLWGLVVCHHSSPRFIPFPVRYACKFLAQVFATLVNKELELENQMVEKSVLRTHTILCDMLLRDAPLGIMCQSPNVMDLVRCVGAVLLYKNQSHRLGVTPNDFQIRDIVLWLDEFHLNSECVSTDSLYTSGFPGALALGDAVCGMVAIRISDDGDWLFWFQSHTAAEIRWGGAKHEPGDRDDGRNLNPRSSFEAFLEVVKTKSLPWKDYEMDAIRSLQLILRNASSKKRDIAGKELEVQVETRAKLSAPVKVDGAMELEAVTSEMVRLIETALVPIFAVGMDGLVNGWNTKISELRGLPVNKAMGARFLALVEDSSVDAVSNMLESAFKGKEEQNVHFEMKTHGLIGEPGPISLVVNACASRDIWGNFVGVCFVAQDITTQKRAMEKFARIEGDYQAIVQNPNLLIPPIFGANEFGWCSEWNTAMIKLSGWQREDVVGKMLLGEVFGTSKAYCRLKNQETCVSLGVVMNNTVAGQDSGKIPFGFFTRVGVYVDCLLCASKKSSREGAVTGLFYFLQLASPELQQALKRQSVLSYVRREIKSPLSGIVFSRTMMEGTDLNAVQRKLVKTSLNCEGQMKKILGDTDLDRIVEGYLDLEMVEFKLHEALVASISQVMVKSNAKGIVIVDNMATSISNKTLLGDSSRLQQVLAAFLLILVNVTPNGGRIAVGASLRKHPTTGESVQLSRLEFRITHSGGGVPQELLNQMFGDELDVSEEGVTLLINRKLVKRMNGDVQYLREAGQSTFIISVDLTVPNKSLHHTV